jgi:uncharacterized protein (DUF305 family)
MTRQRIWTFVTAVVVLLVAGGVIAATRSGDRSAATPQSAPQSSEPPPARVVLPGRPGESASISDSDQVRAPDGSMYNSIDTTFAQMMIVHHAQAIEMAGLAAQRAGDAGVRSLAARISAAQGPETLVLRAWLKARRLSETDAGHDHSTMPGMQSATDMAALAAARGTDFDRRFVMMMTAHHRGALQMADDVRGGGTDQTLSEMANEMAVEQASEIRRMEQLGV